MIRASNSTICVVVFLVLPASGQEATRKDFKKLCSDMGGRWVGDVTWIADWPGLGNKGDKVTAYWQGYVVEDGHLLTGKFVGGNGSATDTIYFDPLTKRIRSVTVASGGTIMNSIFYLKDGHWIQETKVALPNGKAGRVKSVGTIMDGGKTWTWEMNGEIGDDEIKNHKDVWRRVNNQK